MVLTKSKAESEESTNYAGYFFLFVSTLMTRRVFVKKVSFTYTSS